MREMMLMMITVMVMAVVRTVNMICEEGGVIGVVACAQGVVGDEGCVVADEIDSNSMTMETEVTLMAVNTRNIVAKEHST